MTHPNLAKGVGLGARSKAREWNDLASRLNAHGGGATKTGQRWKRYWADLKFKTKSRAASRKQEASGTGGEPGSWLLNQLSETDRKILAIIGEGAVYGDIQHRVPAFPTQSTSASILEVGDIIDYPDEVVVNTSESPPQVSCQSPYIRGHTSRVNTTDAIVTAQKSPGPPRRILESPVSRLQRGSRNQDSQRVTKAAVRTRRESSGVGKPWVVELEQRRVDAEAKLADADVITAEAARTQAEAARMHAEDMREAARTQAEAARMHAEDMREAARTQAEAARMHAEEMREAARTQAEAARIQAEDMREAARTQAEAARMQAEDMREAARTQAEAARMQAEDMREAARTQAEAARMLAEDMREAARTQAEAARMQAEDMREAARTQAEATRMQAEAMRAQAEASRLQAEASLSVAQALNVHTIMLNKIFDMLKK